MNDKPQGPDCGGPGRDDEDEPGPPGPKSPSNAATYNPRKNPSVISKRTCGVGNKAQAQGDTTLHTVYKDIGNKEAEITVLTKKASGGERGRTERTASPGVSGREEKGAEEEKEHPEVHRSTGPAGGGDGG